MILWLEPQPIDVPIALQEAVGGHPLVAQTLARRPRIVRTRHLALPITSRFTYSVLPDHVVTVSAHVANYLAKAGVPAVIAMQDLDRILKRSTIFCFGCRKRFGQVFNSHG